MMRTVDAGHATATPVAVVKFPSVMDVVLDAVIIVSCSMFVAPALNTSMMAFHPNVAVPRPITPVLAVPPVPTSTRKVDEPLLEVIEGLVPKPEEIVGAALNINKRSEPPGDIIKPVLCTPTMEVFAILKSTVPELAITEVNDACARKA